MKRLRRVKLSSSPHCTFLVVIHSWQKPIHAPTACVPADVRCRLLPPSRGPPSQLLPDSVHTITSARAGYDGLVWGEVSYISGLWYMDGKISWQVWAARNLLKIRYPGAMSPHRMWIWKDSEINDLVSLPCALSPCIYSHFIQRLHNPQGFSIRTGRGRSEGSLRWIWLPFMSSLMPHARKSHCL